MMLITATTRFRVKSLKDFLAEHPEAVVQEIDGQRYYGRCETCDLDIIGKEAGEQAVRRGLSIYCGKCVMSGEVQIWRVFNFES
ncbi:MAG: hypothetical protein ABH852_04920 [Methanobacteriota archaeon]